MEKFNRTVIVIVEIKRENKPIDTRYVTIGVMGNSTDQELGEDALAYLSEHDGVKTVKQIISVDSEQYRIFLENNIKDYMNSGD